MAHMENKSYIPKPLDTKNVILPKELFDLTEQIAENVHEVWSKARMDEGWIYGEIKDERNKTSPCLVSYDELDESEKQYDRNTAFETLKMIVKLGYSIRKN